MQKKVFCENCLYYEPPERPYLFSERDAHNPETLEVWLKWDEKLKDREMKEIEQVEEGRPFRYKPWFLPVCERWTEMGRSNWQKDAYGKTIIIYELCYTHNKQNNCEEFKERPS